MQKRGINQGLLSNRDSPRQQKIVHVILVVTDPEVYACGRRTKACVWKTSRDEKSWGEGNGLLRHVWLFTGCCVFCCHKEYRSKNGEGEVSFLESLFISVLSSLQNLLVGLRKGKAWCSKSIRSNEGIMSCDDEMLLGTHLDEAWLVVNLLNGCNLRGTCNYRRRSYRSPTAIIGHWHCERLSFGEKSPDVHRPILSLIHRSNLFANETRYLRYHLI